MLLHFSVHLSYPIYCFHDLISLQSLSKFSIEIVNGIPLWDLCASDCQRSLKIIIIVELFIVMKISPRYLRHNNSDNAENAHSRSYVLNANKELSVSKKRFVLTLFSIGRGGGGALCSNAYVEKAETW